MLDIQASFLTDPKLEDEGVWKPIGKGAELLLARAGNRKYAKMLNKQITANSNTLDLDDDIAEAKSDEIMITCLAAHVLLGWKKLSFGGKEVAYSPENAKMLLAVKDFRKLVMRLSDDMEAYLVKKEVQQGEA
jgi:hypothetical protein